MVDAYCSHYDSNSNAVKVSARKAINTTKIKRVNALLNPNLLREARTFVHDTQESEDTAEIFV